MLMFPSSHVTVSDPDMRVHPVCLPRTQESRSPRSVVGQVPAVLPAGKVTGQSAAQVGGVPDHVPAKQLIEPPAARVYPLTQPISQAPPEEVLPALQLPRVRTLLVGREELEQASAEEHSETHTRDTTTGGESGYRHDSSNSSSPRACQYVRVSTGNADCTPSQSAPVHEHDSVSEPAATVQPGSLASVQVPPHGLIG